MSLLNISPPRADGPPPEDRGHSLRAHQRGLAAAPNASAHWMFHAHAHAHAHARCTCNSGAVCVLLVVAPPSTTAPYCRTRAGRPLPHARMPPLAVAPPTYMPVPMHADWPGNGAGLGLGAHASDHPLQHGPGGAADGAGAAASSTAQQQRRVVLQAKVGGGGAARLLSACVVHKVVPCVCAHI